MLTGLLLNIITSKILLPLIPPAVDWLRKVAIKKLPPALIPGVLGLAGSLVSMTATYLGIEGVPADLPMLGAAAWDGAITGLAAAGLHAAVTKAVAWFKARKAALKAK